MQDYGAGPVMKPAQMCKYTYKYMKHSYTNRNKVRYVQVLTQHCVWILSGSKYKQLYSELKGERRERKKEENEVSLGADWTVMEKFKHITFQQNQKCVLCDQIE